MKRVRGNEKEEEEEKVEYWSVTVESAKSNRSKCKTCGKIIEKSSLRVEVVDDLEFEACGGHSRCSSAPYFELSVGSIATKKYWVHLLCYNPYAAPARPHPPTREYFSLKGASKAARTELDVYLERFRPVTLATMRCLACIFKFRPQCWLSRLPRDVQGHLVSFLVDSNMDVKLKEADKRIAKAKAEFYEKVKDELE